MELQWRSRRGKTAVVIAILRRGDIVDPQADAESAGARMS